MSLDFIVSLCLWLLLSLGIITITAICGEKKLARLIVKIAAGITLCVLLININSIIKGDLQMGLWLALCLGVTILTLLVQLINKKIRKKKPIHWAKKLAGYLVFYVAFCILSLFIIMKLFGTYPGNYLAVDKEYRTLAYELYNATLERYEYSSISKGDHGEIIISFKDHDLSDGSQDRTVKQRDHIIIKNAVEEYFKRNGGLQREWIEIEILDTVYDIHTWEHAGYIYNFNPLTGEMGTDAPYWFITGVDANDCTELAEFYQDFSGINCTVRSMEGVQELTNLSSLAYLELNGVEEGLEGQYLEEVSALLPDCEIYINQYDNHLHSNLLPAWKEFDTE